MTAPNIDEAAVRDMRDTAVAYFAPEARWAPLCDSWLALRTDNAALRQALAALVKAAAHFQYLAERQMNPDDCGSCAQSSEALAAARKLLEAQ